MNRIALVYNGSSYISDLLNLLKKVLTNSEIITLSPNESINGFDAYVFSGRSSRNQVTLKDTFRLIRNVLDFPALYICFGAEALNLYLGGTLRASSYFLKGQISIDFKNSRYIEDGKYLFYVSRHLNIGRLNPLSSAVGFSQFGIEAFEFKKSLALMFHPERSKTQGEKIVRSFFEKSLKML